MTDASNAEPDSGYPRLEQQIRWYDKRSRGAQRFYKGVKLIEFASAAAIPVIATYYSVATAILGGFVLLLESLQHLNQWHHDWIIYRSNCEALRHEKHLYLGGAGDYTGLSADDAKRLLVERVESLVSTEHAKWISGQESAVARLDGKANRSPT